LVIPSGGNKKFCSEKCWQKFLQGRRIRKVCVVCGKEFEVRKSEEKKKCCSWECYRIYVKSEEYRRKHSQKIKGAWASLERRVRQSYVIKIKWQDLKYREKNVRARVEVFHKKPSRLEKVFCDLLQSYFPEEWRYVGDGKVFIAGFVPDFIHKEEDWIIEMNGNYWHSFPKVKERDKEKKEVYRKYGYEVLEIWEDEIMKNPAKVISKIVECFYEK